MVNAFDAAGTLDFQGKDPEEQFQFYFRQHWIRLLNPFSQLLLGTFCIVLGVSLLSSNAVVVDLSTRHALALMLAALFLLLHFRFLARFYRYFLYVFIVTDKKIHRIKKTLLTFNDHQSIDLASLQNIDKRQHGVVQNLFGFGSIVLDAQETQMRIHFVPRIKQCYESIVHLHLQQVRRFRTLAASQRQFTELTPPT